MRVSYEWLNELIKIELSPEELAEKMTMSGIAVEEIEDLAKPYQNMVIAKVISLEKHPQADQLLIAQLDCGRYGNRQVITAAKNLKNGDIIPLALPGAVLPNGKVIEEVNFKGVPSQGMMCSGEELGLEKESTGIWVFDQTYPVGTAVAEALGATDKVLVLELTANRSDCLGMIGVAREVAAILGKTFQAPEPTVNEGGTKVDQLIKITINDPDLCPRYAARVISNVRLGPAPAWMQRRLAAAGVRPINNVVDITNYVMLEYNQPLHSFDLDQIGMNQIIVRRALAGEKLITLDNIQRDLVADNLLIADPNGGLCIAGVMGGSSSEVSDRTVNILLESAYFNPISIRKTARSLGMRTEASLRFERGIDPNGTILALNRAAQLLAEYADGTVAQGYVDVYPNPIGPVTVNTSSARINQLLGTNLAGSEIVSYLRRVTFTVNEEAADRLRVTVPTYRRDVTHAADLAEEVARLYGYDNIPITVPQSKQLGERTDSQKMQADCRKLLQSIGLSEIITYSFHAKQVAQKLRLTSEAQFLNQVELLIPLSEDQAVMRTALTHGLLDTLAFNAKRRQTELAVYEIGRVYWPVDGSILPDEPLHLGIGLMGQRSEKGWNQADSGYDFYDLKGILDLICDKFRLPQYQIRRSALPFLHPGQSGDIYINNRLVGYLGQVHPEVSAEYGLAKQAFIMEIDLGSLVTMQNKQIRYEPLPKFPSIQRDLALVLSKTITADRIVQKIREVTGELAERIELFDVYQGEQVASGERSLAFSITYRSKDRTLNDTEINQIQEQLIQELQNSFGAAVRA